MAGFEEGGMCKGGGERFGALLEPSYMSDGYFLGWAKSRASGRNV